MQNHPRQLAFLALSAIERGVYADVALHRVLESEPLAQGERSLVTELVYGTVRRKRSLSALIPALATRKSRQLPPKLATILNLGLYQLRYLDRVSPSAAVSSTVELAKQNGFSGLSGFVNALMRQYVRLEATGVDVLPTPTDPVTRLGVLHSYPDWIVQLWIEQFGVEEAEKLCIWGNQSPSIDLRVNPLRSNMEEVIQQLENVGIAVTRVLELPQTLRISGNAGKIENLPGFSSGWWSIQDTSAQLVSHLLDPQPGEVIIDACAAPGGKTTHIAELMQDKGQVWACDLKASRLKKLKQNQERLNLQSIQIFEGDSRNLPQFKNTADRVLLDVPCSGLGTLHRHADARWRQTPDSVTGLTIIQQQLLEEAITWVKPEGTLVYSTCTLHPLENEHALASFLSRHPDWEIATPPATFPQSLVSPTGEIKILPHQFSLDGFFMVRLRRR
ncbi:16S rRNA (cytosine(967)-C(5))-methyltransferase [Merismopedia glauca]|uniref:16S rRNA (cytosine(967)-C(5))-methyltransferase n=1 Tax=Merismopedia glauca CCAP 1448/3 TaxID=1296344 RepID=A0A2T1C2U5_9CYAN|nr:16S rRNA (cytosine(967)-C(5))-methyltransferase [Merismopedia glauca]PSB02589.1 16S rRNA (cytosine(967)-C(5))-methyltransferase [Merismopedia glauca CCAP 1448/3]